MGREPTADIHVEGPTVSRRHFQFEYHGENRLYVQDLGSANGTFLNGQRVNRSAVGHGDVIQLGEIRLVMNHRAFAKPKVIPFPNIRTEPGVDVRTFEPALPPLRPSAARKVLARPVPAPEVVLPKWVRLLVMPAVTTATAALLAWGLHTWVSSRNAVAVFEPEPLPTEKTKASRPSHTPKVRVPEVPAGKPPQVALRPASPESPVKKTVPLKLKEPLRNESLPAPTAKREPEAKEKVDATLARSLDHSLEEIGKGNLGNVDQLGASTPTESVSNLAGLKAMGGKAGVLGVDIKFPSVEEIEKAAKAASTAAPNASFKTPMKFDPKQYQAMLKSRIEGVDVCYYEHVKDGSEGKVAVWFSIGTNGGVLKSGVESSTFGNPSLSGCILEKISKLKLDPPPWDGFTVTYGFRFGMRQIKF